MGRRRVSDEAPTTNPPPPAETSKPSAAERTLDMFEGSKLGTTTPADREGEIRKTQDDAIARARARAVQEAGTMKPPQPPVVDPVELEKKLLSEETLAYDKAEREAIQDAPGFDPGAFFGKFETQPSLEALAAAEARPASVGHTLGSGPVLYDEEGDEVEVTKAEEMYGRQGSFSSYRVGPFRLVAKVRAGQTRAMVRAMLLKELHELADEARELEKAKFLGHYPTAFTPTPPAS